MREREPQPTLLLREAALSYASRGWPVFRLAGKVPIIGSHGLKDATTNLQQITAWWTEKPDANIGLVTGQPSGIIVVDIDPRNGGSENIGELEKRYGRLPSTRLSRTAHFGIHRFYAHPKDGTYPNAIQLDKLPGIDVRSDGGYVVIPPSRLGKLQYRWVKEAFPIAPAPKWLLDLIKHSPNNNLPVERPLPTGKKWIDHYLPQANEGNRNAIGFQIICQWRDDGVPEATASVWILEFVERVPQGKSPYLAREALASVRSAYRRPARPPARRG